MWVWVSVECVGGSVSVVECVGVCTVCSVCCRVCGCA